MFVVKHQRLNLRIGMVTLNAGAYVGNVIFMHHLVTFEVEGPLTGA